MSPCSRSPRRLAHADTLARAVNLDMAAAGWSPTVDNYLGRVPKARILEAVREAKGEQSAQLIEHLKKADMAKEAERLSTARVGCRSRCAHPTFRRPRPKAKGKPVRQLCRHFSPMRGRRRRGDRQPIPRNPSPTPSRRHDRTQAGRLRPSRTFQPLSPAVAPGFLFLETHHDRLVRPFARSQVKLSSALPARSLFRSLATTLRIPLDISIPVCFFFCVCVFFCADSFDAQHHSMLEPLRPSFISGLIFRWRGNLQANHPPAATTNHKKEKS